MTSPTIAASDTQTSTVRAAATAWTLNLGTLVEGDIIIASCYMAELIGGGGSWTVTDNGTGTDPTILYESNNHSCLIYKVVEASDVSTLTTITFTTPAARRKGVVFYRIQDHTHGTNPTTISAVNSGSSTAPDPLSVTANTTGLDNLYLAFCGGPHELGVVTPTAAPSGYSTLLTDGFDSFHDVYLGAAHKAATSDSDDPGAFTLDTSVAWVAHVICVQGTAASGVTIPVFMNHYRNQGIM